MTVDGSGDGEQALGLALGFDYDLAILGLTLPRHWTALRVFREFALARPGLIRQLY